MLNMKPKNVVAAGDKVTAQTAQELLWLGGNAFDAAVGAVFTSMVAEPALTSAGGGGHFMACPESGNPVLFDFFVEMPSGKVTSALDFFSVDIDFGGARQKFQIGKGAAGTPGCVAGLLHVQNTLGVLTLKDVLAPSVRAAREGVCLSEMESCFIGILSPILTHSPEGRAVFAPDGYSLGEGDRLVMSEFADFLDTLSREGEKFFYRGEVARIIAEWAKDGGLLRLEDLSGYQVLERSPITVDFAQHTVLLNPPPAQSGVLVKTTLSLLEELASSGGITLSDLVGALEVGDQARQDKLLGSTTHVSVLDRSGNAASVTTTNGEGCGYFLPNLGFMLNNVLGEDDLNPQGFHKCAAGTRLPSMIAPTVVTKEGKAVLLTGSGGSKRIRSIVVQLIVNYLCHEMGIEEATAAPRVHLDGDTLHVEPGVSEEALAALESRYRVCRWDEQSVFFGGAHSATPTQGAGDSRRGGCCIVF